MDYSEPAYPWIVDSGAICHISNTKEPFEVFEALARTQHITLDDGRRLEAIGTGVVTLKLKLPGWESKVSRLGDVQYVPDLAYNLIIAPKVTKVGKEVTFDEAWSYQRWSGRYGCYGIQGTVGSPYYLNCEPLKNSSINSTATSKANETLWHRQFEHQGEWKALKCKPSAQDMLYRAPCGEVKP